MTWLDWHDTIAAIATTPAAALRGIVRISGPKVDAILAGLKALPAVTQTQATHPRRARCWPAQVQLPHPWGQVPAVVYHWPEGASYTRQEMAELHLPGSPPLVSAVLEAVCQRGARLARPGEFTLRAFLAGRLDLTQAEAVLGTIQAHSPPEMRAALRQLAGGLARPLAKLREELLDLLAHLEATLDFADEEVPLVAPQELQHSLEELMCRVDQLARQMQGRLRRDLVPRVVLVGRPNAGKSSLLNALAGEETSLVSPQEGTTRDAVTCRVHWAGRELMLCDTAGLAEAADPLSRAAQDATWQQIDQADLVLLCRDRSQPLAAGDALLADQLAEAEKPYLVVWTKCDLPAAAPASEETLHVEPPAGQACHGESVATSSRTGEGLATLREAIVRHLEAGPAEVGVVASTAERCRHSLAAAAAALTRACQAAQQPAEELVAAELRLALDALGEVTGSVYTEDILDRIFQRFCIGK